MPLAARAPLAAGALMLPGAAFAHEGMDSATHAAPTASVVLWHVPAFFKMASASHGTHAFMQGSFLIAAILFWSVVLEPASKRRLDYGRTILFVLSAALVSGLVGALISFARFPIYLNA